MRPMWTPSLTATKTRWVYLVALHICLLVSCGKDEEAKCDFNGAHKIELPVSLHPARETYKIGDTIAVSSVFATSLFDRVTMENYELKNFRFEPLTFVANLDSIYSPESAGLYGLEYFDVIIDSTYNYFRFYYSNGGQSLLGEYAMDSGFYHLRYKLVPRKAGFFLVWQASALVAEFHDQTFSGQCPNKGIDFISVLNGKDSDDNIDFLKQSPDEHWNDWVLAQAQERFYDRGSFAFRVIE